MPVQVEGKEEEEEKVMGVPNACVGSDASEGLVGNGVSEGADEDRDVETTTPAIMPAIMARISRLIPRRTRLRWRRNQFGCG